VRSRRCGIEDQARAGAKSSASASLNVRTPPPRPSRRSRRPAEGGHPSPTFNLRCAGALRTTPRPRCPARTQRRFQLVLTARLQYLGNETPAACTRSRSPCRGEDRGLGLSQLDSWSALAGPLRSTIWMARIAPIMSSPAGGPEGAAQQWDCGAALMPGAGERKMLEMTAWMNDGGGEVGPCR